MSMRFIFGGKRQAPGYCFATSCYERFQLIVVETGQLQVRCPEAALVVGSGQLLLLPLASRFQLRCRGQGYSGIGILSDDRQSRLRGGVRRLDVDAGLQALVAFLHAEIADPHPERQAITQTIATMLVEEALRLADPEASREGTPVYWAEKMRRAIEHNLYTDRSVAECVANLALSYRQLARHFSAVYDQPPKAFQLRLKLEKSRQRLLSSADQLVDIAEEFGFTSVQHFSAQFSRHFGRAPGNFRQEYQLKQAVDGPDAAAGPCSASN